MSQPKAMHSDPSEQRRMLVALRIISIAAIVIVVYYVFPFHQVRDLSLGVKLVAALLILLGVGAWHIKAVMEAANPQVRAAEALAVFVPLLLVVFSATYFIMAQTEPSGFNVGALTRTDALYFTVTVFSTVGFGDINPISQAGRVVVMIQIILDILLLGVGLRLLTQAAQVGSTRRASERAAQAETTGE